MSGMNVHAVTFPGSISNFQSAPRDGNNLQKAMSRGLQEYAHEEASFKG